MNTSESTQGIKSFFSFKNISGEMIRFSDIRPSRYVYYMAYSFELIFFSVRNNFLPMGANPFGIRGWMIAKTAHMVASLVVMLLWTKKFTPLLRTVALIMLAGFIPFIFLPMGYIRFIFGLIGYIGLGGVVTGARCGYAYAANNAERLFGILLMFFSVTIVRWVSSLNVEGLFVEYVLPIALLVLLTFCVFKFKEEDLEVKEESSKEDVRGLYWALAFFIVYFAIDGYIASLADIESNDFVYMIVGSFVAGIILISVFFRIHFSEWHLWNLFFLFAVAMGVFAVIAPMIKTAIPQYLFGGMSYMGWPLCIYTLACAQRKFASYKLLKKCTLIYVIFTPITTLSSNLIDSFFPNHLPIVALVYILVVTIIMLMLSPISYQHLFASNWIEGIFKVDMTLLHETIEKKDRFEKYGLTPRQKEVAALLLAAKTRRQIAGELGLSESTVKMHTSELYKRLNINSRAELFKIFGVAEEYDTQESE